MAKPAIIQSPHRKKMYLFFHEPLGSITPWFESFVPTAMQLWSTASAIFGSLLLKVSFRSLTLLFLPLYSPLGFALILFSTRVGSWHVSRSGLCYLTPSILVGTIPKTWVNWVMQIVNEILQKIPTLFISAVLGHKSHMKPHLENSPSAGQPVSTVEPLQFLLY